MKVARLNFGGKQVASRSSFQVKSVELTTQTNKFSTASENLRRKNFHQGWKPPIDWEESIIFMDGSRHGEKDLDNFSISSLSDVLPQKDHYMNLHHRGFVHFSNAKLDENKALHAVPERHESNFQSLVQLSPSQTNKLIDRTIENMQEENLFTVDRAVGAHPSVEVRLRIITNNPNHALFFEQMLNPLRVHRFEEPAFVPELTVYIPSSSFKLENPQAFGITSSDYSVFNPTTARLIFGGSPDTLHLARDVFLAASSIALGKQGGNVVPVASSSFVKGNKLALVVGDSEGLLSQNVTIHGGHHHFLTSQGLIRAWNSANYPFSKKYSQKGIFVTANGNTKRAVVPVKSSILAPAPSSIIFVSDLGAPVVQLSNEEATLLFASGFNGKSFQPFFGSVLPSSDLSVVASKFQSLLQEHKIQAYAVKTVDSALSDSAPKAEKSQGTKFKEIKDFLSKTFPNLKL